MSKNLIFITTTTEQPVLVNGIIPLTTIQRNYGCSFQTNSNSVILRNAGYYKINASITLTGQTVGDATVQLQKNGVDVVGITSSTTITTATTETRTLNINGIVRVYCNEGFATLNIVNSGVAINVQNVALDIEYIG